MAPTLPSFWGLVEVLTFLTFDFIYARSLSRHKNNHPELEECAPSNSPDLDPVGVLDGLTKAAEKPPDHLTGGGVFTLSFTRDQAPSEVLVREGRIGKGFFGVLHAMVVLCGISAPILTLLTLLFPFTFSWTLFSFPVWVSYLVVTPGLGATALYVTRVIMLLELVEVTKTQWISMMWFRLDFIFIMSVVAFIGAGAWLITLCMISVAIYSVYRIIKIEKHLNQLHRDTQLMRGEVDVDTINKSGTVESKKITEIHEAHSSSYL
ncbi:unnamed protein product [Phytomonas sp. Hart1]|nr:unnamed protein product [Phytomonas sp. Hart1]|eukprot:CCW72009.1 unnamed protein product [Phytomonas sp. isolate Hart1]